MPESDRFPVLSPTLAHRGLSGLPTIEIRPPSSREALEAEAMRREGERLAADIAEQERAGAALEKSLRLFAGITDAERAELRFALHCDPELRSILDRGAA